MGFDQSEPAQGPIKITNTHMIDKKILQALQTLPSIKINQRIIKTVCEREGWGE